MPIDGLFGDITDIPKHRILISCHCVNVPIYHKTTIYHNY